MLGLLKALVVDIHTYVGMLIGIIGFAIVAYKQGWLKIG
jgi:hypothetical protein